MGDGNGSAGMAEQGRRLADALSRLVREHFDLARAELKADTTRLGQDLAVGLAALPFVFLALLFLELALAALLARAVGLPLALLLVASIDLVLAAGLGLLSFRRMREARRSPALRGTATELQLDRRVLGEVGRELVGNGNVNGNGNGRNRPPSPEGERAGRHAR